MIKRIIKGRHGTEIWLAGIIVLICIGLSYFVGEFLTSQNLFDLLNANAVNVIFASGLAVVLIAGGIDISFAVAASVVQYLVALLVVQMGDGSNWFVGVAAASIVGFTLGSINALLICYFRIVSIIVTIGTFNAFFGLLMFFTGGRSIYVLPDWWTDRVSVLQIETSGGDFARLNLPVLVMLIILVFTWLVLTKTNLGRLLYAFGDREDVAERVGIPPMIILLIAYGWMGITAGIAGLMQVYVVQEVRPSALYGRELFVLAAVTLGGVMLGGGKGSVIGAFLGVALLAIIQNGLNLMGITPFAFNIFIGAIVLIAVSSSGLMTKGKRDER